MQIKCPRCGQVQPIDISFCANCGLARPNANRSAAPTQSTADSIVKPFTDWFTALGLLYQSLLIGGIIVFLTLFFGGILIASKKDREAKLLAQANATPAPTATIAPTPAPPTFAELKTNADSMMKMTGAQLLVNSTRFDDISAGLEAIPAGDKNYKEAQALRTKLINKIAPAAAAKFLLGDRPTDGELKLAFNNYLRTRLNDYDSSEYVEYTSAQEITVKGEPFWLSVLTLRAKNAFGGYVLRNVKMYIRQKEVVLAEGL